MNEADLIRGYSGVGAVREETRDRRLGGSNRRRVRFTDAGFELQCLACFEWWPISTDFWRPPALARCKACRNEGMRISAAAVRRRESRAQRADRIDANRDYWRRNAEDINARRRQRTALSRARAATTEVAA